VILLLCCRMGTKLRCRGLGVLFWRGVRRLFVPGRSRWLAGVSVIVVQGQRRWLKKSRSRAGWGNGEENICVEGGEPEGVVAGLAVECVGVEGGDLDEFEGARHCCRLGWVSILWFWRGRGEKRRGGDRQAIPVPDMPKMRTCSFLSENHRGTTWRERCTCIGTVRFCLRGSA
jgi:hypothetical protein